MITLFGLVTILLKCSACIMAFLLPGYLYVKTNPKLLIHLMHRFLLYKLGISKKEVKGEKSSRTYCYLERGAPKETPSILMVHGYSSSKYDYLGLLTFMSRGYHVVVLDLPGHGETPLGNVQELNIMLFVRAVNEFVKVIGLDKNKFHILGTSMGGHIAGLYAAEYPEKLESLILICPHGIHFGKQQAMIDEAMDNQKFVLLPQTMDEMKHMLDVVLYRKPKIRDVFVAGILQLRLENNQFYRKLGEALLAPESCNLLEKHLEKINTPVLLIWGKEDQILHVDCVETIKTKLPSPPQQTVVLDQVGHGVPVERPRKLSFIIQNFIKSLKLNSLNERKINSKIWLL